MLTAVGSASFDFPLTSSFGFPSTLPFWFCSRASRNGFSRRSICSRFAALIPRRNRHTSMEMHRRAEFPPPSRPRCSLPHRGSKRNYPGEKRMRCASRSPFLADFPTIIPAPKNSLEVPHLISVAHGSIPLSMPLRSKTRRSGSAPRRGGRRGDGRPGLANGRKLWHNSAGHPGNNSSARVGSGRGLPFYSSRLSSSFRSCLGCIGFKAKAGQGCPAAKYHPPTIQAPRQIACADTLTPLRWHTGPLGDASPGLAWILMV